MGRQLREREPGEEMRRPMGEVSVPGGLKATLFGPLHVEIGGEPLPHLRSRKGAWLLGLLALRHDREVARDFLMAALWPDYPPESAAVSLRQSLSDLRRALGSYAARLVSPTPYTVRLCVAPGEADVVDFDLAVAAGDTASLERAVALYRGPLLEGCAEEWVAQERDAREQAWLAALEKLASHELESGSPAAAVGYLRKAVAADPLRESAQRGLMQALARGGDYAAVLVTYRDLRLLLRRELNCDPDPTTTAIYEQLRAEARARSRQTAPAPASPGPRRGAPTRLPCATTDLVGREHETEEVLEALTAARLVTLTGPGGVGKTRLAMHVAERWAEGDPEGVWFVDLASVLDDALVAPTVAAALGVPDGPAGDALKRIAAFMRPVDGLVVLDNCEQVAASSAQLAADVLGACPGLRILATSRQVLGVAGEAVCPVPPLTVPTPDAALLAEAGGDPQKLMQFEAVRLFSMRARLARPGFTLTPDNASAVARICCRLDGLPLALQLAAARVRAMPPAEIAAHLNDRFHLLTSGGAAGPERHRALDATMEWSYRLLQPAEQALLRRLSVFSGGWTHDAAEAVCADLGSAEDVLAHLVGLVDKSLVVHEWQNGDGRYRLLETVRQFALERLAASGEEAQARARHRDYFLALAEEARAWEGLPGQAWFQMVEADHDNMRAAMDFSLACPCGDEAARFARALALYWMGHCRVEGMARLQAALDCPGGREPPELRARVLLWAAESAWGQGRSESARSYAQEALRIYSDAGNRSGVAYALEALGDAAYGAGEFTQARDLWETSLSHMQALGNAAGTAMLLGNLGEVHRREGRAAEARRHYEESRAASLAAGSRLAAALAAVNLAAMACEQGDHRSAGPLLREALPVLWDTGCHWFVPLSLPSFAAVALADGDCERAGRLLGAAEALRERLGTVIQPADSALWDRCLADLHATCEPARWSPAWSAGRDLSMQAAVAYALEEP